MKSLLKFVLLALVIVGLAVWYFVSFRLDSMIQNQIETRASASLGTAVSVGGVNTSIKEGSLTISSITVANPEGFENDTAFSLNNIEAAVDFETMEIKRVIIENPEIVVEERGGQTNFTQLLSNIESNAGEAPEPTESGEPEPVITVHHFRMSEARAAFESKSMDHYSDLNVKAVELNNLKGTPSEVGSQIATAVVEKIISAAAVELLKAKASEKMDGLLGRDKD